MWTQGVKARRVAGSEAHVTAAVDQSHAMERVCSRDAWVAWERVARRAAGSLAEAGQDFLLLGIGVRRPVRDFVQGAQTPTAKSHVRVYSTYADTWGSRFGHLGHCGLVSSRAGAKALRYFRPGMARLPYQEIISPSISESVRFTAGNMWRNASTCFCLNG